MARFPVLLILFSLLGCWILTVSPVLASNVQPSLSLGMSFFPQSSTGLTSETGYLILFQVEQRDKWIRPAYGGQLEFSSNGNMLIDGQMLGGVEVVANSALYVKPFVGAYGLFGWATLIEPSSTFVGLIYGALLSTGFEIRFSQKDRTSAVRIGSQWRFVSGTIGGGLTGADLNTFQITIGLTF